MEIQKKFGAFRDACRASLLERDGEIDALLTAALCGQHVLLVGAPGTAKSMLADAFTRWVGGRSFSVLLTKFTNPEELFGPWDLPKLRDGSYERLTAGYLPEAHVAFVDEIWKASSAICNTLLTLLNERRFRNGTQVLDCPLLVAVAASNEWPSDQEGGKELGAMFDRFLFRRTVRDIRSQQAEMALLDFDGTRPRGVQIPDEATITPDEVLAARAAAMATGWTQEARDAFVEIRKSSEQEGIHPGARRRAQSVDACRAAAWLAGSDEVRPDHLEVLADTLWEDPAEQPAALAKIVGKVANPVGMAVQSLLIETEQILAGCNVRDLGQAAAATAKLGEIAKKLASVGGGNGRAKAAREYVLQASRDIKRATVDAM